MIARVLEKTGSMLWYCGIMYKAVAQSVLLYRSESWVVTRAGVQADHGDNSDTWGGQGVVISSGGDVTGSRGTTPNNGVH